LGYFVIGKGKKMNKSFTVLYTDSKEEVAQDIARAVQSMWPCYTDVRLDKQSDVYQVFTLATNLSVEQKKLIPAWAGGYRFAKYGE
jgi:hypothetical protein